MDSNKALELKALIEKRKSLEKELKTLTASLPKEAVPSADSKETFRTYIRIGDTLKKYVSQVKRYKKRDCFDILSDFIYDTTTDTNWWRGTRASMPKNVVISIISHVVSKMWDTCCRKCIS